jgi:hypothetical protein
MVGTAECPAENVSHPTCVSFCSVSTTALAAMTRMVYAFVLCGIAFRSFRATELLALSRSTGCHRSLILGSMDLRMSLLYAQSLVT